MAEHYADFSNEELTKIKNIELDRYIKQAVDNENNGGKSRYRYCLHNSPEDELHEMIMCVTDKDYFRPHKHLHATESNMIIKGCILSVFFHDDGSIRDHFVLGKNENEYLVFRINPNIYHMSIPLSENVVFYEVRKGPFDPDDVIYAKWAPENKSEIYINEIIKRTIGML